MPWAEDAALNPLRDATPAVARTLPEELQKLVGYDFGAPYLGFVEAGHPLTLLRASTPADMARTSPEADARAASLKPIIVREG